MARAFLWIAAFAIAFCTCTPAYADEPGTIPADVASGKRKAKLSFELGNWTFEAAKCTDPVHCLSKMMINEEGWEMPKGWDMVGQIIRNVRAKDCVSKPWKKITGCENGRESFLSAMRRLSKRTTGQREPNDWRQLWTSTLQWGDAQPVGWVECVMVKNKRGKLRKKFRCHGTWSQYVDRWRRARKHAKRLYAGGLRRRPCPGPNASHRAPIAWGGPQLDVDAYIAEKRGLVEVDCGEGVKNKVYARPKKSADLVGLGDLEDPVSSDVVARDPDVEPAGGSAGEGDDG